MPSIILSNREGYLKKENQWFKYALVEDNVFLDPVSVKESKELDKEFNN